MNWINTKDKMPELKQVVLLRRTTNSNRHYSIGYFYKKEDESIGLALDSIVKDSPDMPIGDCSIPSFDKWIELD